MKAVARIAKLRPPLWVDVKEIDLFGFFYH